MKRNGPAVTSHFLPLHQRRSLDFHRNLHPERGRYSIKARAYARVRGRGPEERVECKIASRTIYYTDGDTAARIKTHGARRKARRIAKLLRHLPFPRPRIVKVWSIARKLFTNASTDGDGADGDALVHSRARCCASSSLHLSLSFSLPVSL